MPGQSSVSRGRRESPARPVPRYCDTFSQCRLLYSFRCILLLIQELQVRRGEWGQYWEMGATPSQSDLQYQAGTQLTLSPTPTTPILQSEISRLHFLLSQPSFDLPVADRGMSGISAGSQFSGSKSWTSLQCPGKARNRIIRSVLSWETWRLIAVFSSVLILIYICFFYFEIFP